MMFYREIAIRKATDKPTIEMLDMWHSLSEEATGASMEVMARNRKEQRQLKAFSGELYTGIPQVVEGKAVLVLWLDNLSDIQPLMVTHEIGHWILKLRGFRAFHRKHKRYSNIEIMLNSTVHHPPLYALQRSLGHEPQAEINSRCLQNIKLFSKRKEATNKEVWVANALMLADDIFNSEENRTSLINVINKRHPQKYELLTKIIRLESSYDLLDRDQNLNFSERLIKILKLGDHSDMRDETPSLVSMVRNATIDKSQQSKS